MPASHHGGFLPWSTGSRLLDFTSCGSQALELGVVVARRLSCSAACRIFSGQGLNPCTLPWQACATVPPDVLMESSYSISIATFFFFFSWPRCMACRILFPRPGIEPVPPAMEVRSLTTELPGNREFPIRSISMI